MKAKYLPTVVRKDLSKFCMLKNCQASFPVLIPSPHSQSSFPVLIPRPRSQALHVCRLQYEICTEFVQGLGTRLHLFHSWYVRFVYKFTAWLVQTYFLLGMCGMRCVQYLSTVNESQRWELPTTWHLISQVLICYHGNLSSCWLFYWIWKHKQGIEYERNSCKNVAFGFSGTGNTSVFSKHCFAMM